MVLGFRFEGRARTVSIQSSRFRSTAEFRAYGQGLGSYLFSKKVIEVSFLKLLGLRVGVQGHTYRDFVLFVFLLNFDGQRLDHTKSILPSRFRSTAEFRAQGQGLGSYLSRIRSENCQGLGLGFRVILIEISFSKLLGLKVGVQGHTCPGFQNIVHPCFRVAKTQPTHAFLSSF